MPTMNSNKASLYLGNSTCMKFVFTSQFLNKQLQYRLKTSPRAQCYSSYWSVIRAMLPWPQKCSHH